MTLRQIIPLITLSLFLILDSAAQSSPAYRFTVENMKVINSRFSELSLTPHTDSTYILMSDRGGKDKYDKWVGGAAYNLYLIDRSDWTNIWQPKGLNSKFSDGPAAVGKNGEMIITQTNKRAQTDEKTGLLIYELNLSKATYNSGNWLVEVLPEFTSKEYSYAHPTVSVDGKTMILASSHPEGYGGRDLYISYKTKGKWSTPINLGPNVNSSRDETFPFLHPDGSLYFTSNGHPGFGGTDIFVSRKEGINIDEWEAPLNLGEPVNTAANEYGIYFNAVMDRGFVSSNRMGGKGGDDIYAIFVDKIYDRPTASNDGTTLGTEEISSEELEKYESTAEEKVADAVEEIKEAVMEEPAVIEIKEPESTEDAKIETIKDEGQKGRKRNRKVQENPVEVVEIVIPPTSAVIETAVDAAEERLSDVKIKEDDPIDGVTVMEVQPSPDFEGEIVGEDLAHVSDETEVAAVEVVEEVKVIEPTSETSERKDAVPINSTEAFFLEQNMRDAGLINVYFNMNSSRLDEEGEELLDELALLLTEYDHPILELHAHADATGDHNINIKLSELRARSIMQYLRRKGISLDRMRYLAYGESDLYVDQDADMKLNRRVEFRLQEYDHHFLDKNDPGRIAGFAYKQLPMLEDQKYFVQMAALSDMRTFSTYKLQEYGAAICFYRGGMYKYVLGPFDTMEEATVHLKKVRLNYRDAFIFKNE